MHSLCAHCSVLSLICHCGHCFNLFSGDSASVPLIDLSAASDSDEESNKELTLELPDLTLAPTNTPKERKAEWKRMFNQSVNVLADVAAKFTSQKPHRQLPYMQVCVSQTPCAPLHMCVSFCVRRHSCACWSTTVAKGNNSSS